MRDKTEGIRRSLCKQINKEAGREELEKRLGSKVWNTQEATSEFIFKSFIAPVVLVVRKKDGIKGTLMFQDRPRYYFNFIKEEV